MIFNKIFKKPSKKTFIPGDRIHPFTLITHTGAEYEYGPETRSKLMLYFFPNAWSDTSKAQILSIENNYNRFLRFNFVPLCITTDTPASIKTWAKTLSLRNVRILSDFWPHGYVTNSFGILNRHRGCPEHAIIIIDDDMTIIQKNILDHAQDFDIEAIFSFITKKKG